MLVGEVFARMGLDSKQYEKDLSKLEGVTRREATTLGSIFKNAFSVALGMGVFEAVKRGFRAVVGESISFNAQMEQARMGFTTMLGSAERAEAFLSDMAEFAAKTPFEFPELLDASKRMLAYGFAAGDVLPMMEAVGNATAALGLGAQGIDRIILALGQMRAKGKLSGEEMRQLTEAGIPAWEMLAEAMGKTTAEIMDMQSKGLIPADRAIKMLVEGMNKRFPNMMAQMENTWEGVTSTIKDVWRMTIGAVTQNLFQGVVSWLQKVRDFAVDFYDTFQKYGLQRAISESFGPEVAAMVSLLGAALRGLASVVSAVTGFITQYGKQLKFVAIVMGTYLVLLKTVTLAKWLATVATTALTNSQLLLAGQSSATTGIIGFLSNVITFYKVQMLTASATTNVFTGALVRLRAALYAVWTALGPVGWAILGISLAVAGGMSLWNKYSQSVYSGAKVHEELAKVTDQVEGSVGGAAGAIEDEADALKKAGKAAGKNIQSFDEVHQLQEDMAGSAEDLAESMGLNDTGLGVPEVGDFEIPDIGAQLEEMKPTLKGFWEWIKQGAANLWETVKQKWSDFANWVKSWDVWDWIGQKWQDLKDVTITVWNAIASAISNVWNWLSGLVSGIFGPIGEFISTTWNNLLETTTTIWNTIWTTLSTIWNDLLSTSSTIFGAIWTFISDTWNNLWATVSTVWNLIWTFLSGLWNNIWTTAGIIWQAIADLITGKIDLRTAVAIIWNAIVTFFTTTWESIRSTASGIWEAIAGFIIGTWEGLKTAAETIWNAIATFFSNTWDNIKNAVEVIWNAIKTFFITTWENLKETALTVWQTIEQYIVDPIRRAWDGLKEIWSNIKTFILNKWDEIKQGISSRAKPLIDAIKSPFNIAKDWIAGIIDDAYNWGKNLISNIIDGIESKINAVKNAVSNVASTIGSYIGFSSPTKEGPGRYADKWAPNFMEMYRRGLTQGIPGLRSSVSTLADEMAGLASVTVQPTVRALAGYTTESGMVSDGIAQAVYKAIIDAFRITQASSTGTSSGESKELVLKIDNTVLARMQLPALTREAQRQGFDLVLRPQGV